LLYLSYGAGPIVDEITFSILTALRFLRDTSAIQIVVYTDTPAAFASLPVRIREVTANELALWQGSAGYTHRRKTCVIQDALKTFGGRIAFVDSDTWFRRSPKLLFDRIGPGRTCLHLREVALRNGAKGLLDAFLKSREFFDVSGQRRNFAEKIYTWNSGVVGIDEADVALMQDVLFFIDDVWIDFKEVADIEQFATSHVFCEETDVSEVGDIVFHYWPRYLRDPFRDRLPSILLTDTDADIAQRANVVFPHRPRPTGLRRLKVALRNLVGATGLWDTAYRANG
jgi:hypothetical protein